MTNDKQNGRRRNVTGIVISDRMDKTITVQVTRLVKHPRYRKYVKRSKNYKAHDEDNEYRINDTVILEECRPLSKTKRWTVVQRASL